MILAAADLLHPVDRPGTRPQPDTGAKTAPIRSLSRFRVVPSQLTRLTCDSNHRHPRHAGCIFIPRAGIHCASGKQKRIVHAGDRGDVGCASRFGLSRAHITPCLLPADDRRLRIIHDCGQPIVLQGPLFRFKRAARTGLSLRRHNPPGPRLRSREFAFRSA
jgi:hypothetical protein